ncbi:MAG: TrkA C-terminal domain-containing protein [Mycobacterium sp.]
MYAIASLLAVLAVSLLVTRVATVVLVASGMSAESARFQARSAFTGAGFTTTESEQVVGHPLRRRVMMMLMLVGNIGFVAAATSLIIGFRGSAPGSPWLRVIELAAGLILLVYVSRSPWVNRWLTALISRILRRWTDLEGRDSAVLTDLADGYVISELAIEADDWAAGRSLGELRLPDEGLLVLGISSGEGDYVAYPNSQSRLAGGDVLVLYGHTQTIAELDHRAAGDEGDAAHARAVERHAARGADSG